MTSLTNFILGRNDNDKDKQKNKCAHRISCDTFDPEIVKVFFDQEKQRSPV